MSGAAHRRGPPRTRRSPVTDIEQLEQAIRRLVSARQALRDRGAGRDEIEQNRLLLAGLQRRLTKRLIDRHLHAEAAPAGERRHRR